MSKIVDLKIKLDLLRKALDEEFDNGSSIDRVRKLYETIQDIEEALASLKENAKIIN